MFPGTVTSTLSKAPTETTLARDNTRTLPAVSSSARGAQDYARTELAPQLASGPALDVESGSMRREPPVENPQSPLRANEVTTAPTVGLSGPVSENGAETVRRGSKRSLTAKGRTGSVGSNSRSARTQPLVSEKEKPSATTPGQVRPKRGGVSRFLALLNCCSRPEEQQAVDPGEAAEPAKKVVKVPSGRTSQPPTGTRQNASAADSSMADSKEPLDEKVTAEGEQLARVDREEPTKAVQGDATVDNPVTGASGVASASPARNFPPEDSVPSEKSSTQAPVARLDVRAANTLGYATTNNPHVMVQAPTPVVPHHDSGIISDRTPRQEDLDTDIEMTDAGPSVPLASTEVHASEEDETSRPLQKDVGPAKVDLPPPPPLAERQVQVVGATSGYESDYDPSIATAPAEGIKWLLPPMRPEFRGKKCLVLDLDETLVHSSFKVRVSMTSSESCTANT